MKWSLVVIGKAAGYQETAEYGFAGTSFDLPKGLRLLRLYQLVWTQ